MLRQPALFFMAVRGNVLGPVVTQSEVDGCNAILAAMQGSPIAHAAYALATAYHETAHTMQPIIECGGRAYFTRMYDCEGRRPKVAARLGNYKPGDGALFCGRGYVQLTGRINYAKAAKELDLPLEQHPEMALRPDVAAKIMRRGMDEGWFTGYGFDAFLPDTRPANAAEFIQARRIINGSDRAADIADYAKDFQAALQEGGWA
jgi:hypothetical protein